MSSYLPKKKKKKKKKMKCPVYLFWDFFYECGGKKCFDGSLGTAYHIWTLGGWNDKMAALEISMFH